MKRASVLVLTLALLAEIALIKASSIRRPRIIGGQAANAGQFPWAAAIYKTTANGNYFCGGAVLSTRFIITAGQCVADAIVFTIILGANNLEEDHGNLLRLAAETYYLHEEYNPATLENDIGLIKFREPITLTMYIGMLSQLSMAIEDGEELKAVGWGQVSDTDSSISNELKWVELTNLSNDECRIYYGSQVKDEMICVAGQYNEGPCYGDTGAPLVKALSNHIEEWDALVGISSFVSANGCESTNPAGYTRFFPYYSWVHNITTSW